MPLVLPKNNAYLKLEYEFKELNDVGHNSLACSRAFSIIPKSKKIYGFRQNAFL